MKSDINVDIRTPYCDMIFKRSPEEQVSVRQKIVRYAQQNGNKAAARHCGSTARTVRTRGRRFEEQSTRALVIRSRAPHRRPHKLSIELEERIVKKRQEAPFVWNKQIVGNKQRKERVTDQAIV